MEKLKIWKQTLRLVDYQKIMLPIDADMLDVQIRDGNICIWFMCTPGEEMRERGFYIVGTGHSVPDAADVYVGTVQKDDFVWHVFMGDNYE